MDTTTPIFLYVLSCRIAAHLKRSGEADSALAALLASTANTAWQTGLCRSLLADDDFATEVASRSYWHGNGFLKVVLMDRGFKLRLHLWFPGTACEENIHDHRWSIASTVIAGELHSETWADATQDGDVDLQAQEFRYLTGYCEQPARTVPLAKTPLRFIGRTRHTTGDSYALPTSTLHRICNHGERMVATLMCSGPAMAGHTRLIAGQEGLRPKVASQRLSVTELRSQIARFAALAGLFPALSA